MHFHEFSFIIEKYYFFFFKRTSISDRYNDLANAKKYIKDYDIHAKGNIKNNKLKGNRCELLKIVKE